jgi:hypothetical protein
VLVQLALDLGFAETAVGGDRARAGAGAAEDPADRGRELRRICRVTPLEGVV